MHVFIIILGSWLLSSIVVAFIVYIINTVADINYEDEHHPLRRMIDEIFGTNFNRLPKHNESLGAIITATVLLPWLMIPILIIMRLASVFHYWFSSFIRYVLKKG